MAQKAPQKHAPIRAEIRQQIYMLNMFYGLSKALEMPFIEADEIKSIIELQEMFRFYLTAFMTAESKRIYKLYGGNHAD